MASWSESKINKVFTSLYYTKPFKYVILPLYKVSAFQIRPKLCLIKRQLFDINEGPWSAWSSDKAILARRDCELSNISLQATSTLNAVRAPDVDWECVWKFQEYSVRGRKMYSLLIPFLYTHMLHLKFYY